MRASHAYPKQGQGNVTAIISLPHNFMAVKVKDKKIGAWHNTLNERSFARVAGKERRRESRPEAH